MSLRLAYDAWDRSTGRAPVTAPMRPAPAAGASGGDICRRLMMAGALVLLSGCGLGAPVGSAVGGAVGGTVDLILRSDTAPFEVAP